MPFYNFEPGGGAAPARLTVDGEIVSGGWAYPGDVDAAKFCRQLEACREVDVIINSPGGDVFAGAQMYSMLRAHPYKVRVMIAGIAASAASVVAMAGDEVLISPAGYMMIHNPWMLAAGDAREMEKAADDLREIGKGILAAYKMKTGMEESELQALLDNETYMNAQSAIEMGFADGLWLPDTVLTGAAPAARMAGRHYTPQAVMARLRAAAAGPENRDTQAIADGGAAEKRKRLGMLARAMKIDENGVH